jgi:hypothetical protein
MPFGINKNNALAVGMRHALVVLQMLGFSAVASSHCREGNMGIRR